MIDAVLGSLESLLLWLLCGGAVLAAVLMIVHFWRVRKDGGISGPL